MFKFKIKKSISLFLLSCLLPSCVFAENLKFTSFGHSSFLIKAGGQSILLNPFKAIGCASNLKETNNIKSDLILASSRLSDEGYNPSNKLMFVDPGVYKFKETIINGIKIPHDRFNGRRFGMSTVWAWKQNNLKIVHMGGAAGDITLTDEIILSRPDILFISIGGGKKGYDGLEAAEIVKKLKPNIIIPVHFKKNKKNQEYCDFSNADLFLKNVSGYKIKSVGKNFQINKKKSKNKLIYIVN